MITYSLWFAIEVGRKGGKGGWKEGKVGRKGSREEGKVGRKGSREEGFVGRPLVHLYT